MSDLTLILLAKSPRPGFVKTRLTPSCTPEQAAFLAEAALRDTIDVLSQTPADRRILCLEGPPGDWATDSFDVVPQVAGPLDVRIANALVVSDGPVVLVGMDTPQITPDLLQNCDFDAFPAWIGEASDGGYWLLGLAEPQLEHVQGVPMSTPHTYAVQRQRLHHLGLTVGNLPVLRDVDTWADATAVAEIAPTTRFARAYEQVCSTQTNEWVR